MSPTGRTAFLLSALSTVARSQTVAPKLDANCDDVVIFMARGNNAPYHDNRTFPFVDATCAKLVAEGKTCDYIEIEFDVTLGGPYCDQVAQGAANGISQITNFNQKCPCTAIVVNGYSEGANVVGDVLAGPGGCTGTSTGIDNTSAAGKAIAAALLWGDVRHTANQPYNVLDGADKQVNPRPESELALLDRYSSLLRSYCAAGDPVCAGGDVVNDHLDYFENYTDDASSWVVSKVNEFKGTCATPTPIASSSSATLSTATPVSTSVAATTVATSAPTSAPAPGYSTVTPVSSSPATEYPAWPSFPAPVPYDGCVVKYEMKYVYA